MADSDGGVLGEVAASPLPQVKKSGERSTMSLYFEVSRRLVLLH